MMMKTLPFLMVLLCPFFTYSQKVITGFVLDEAGEPIISANVLTTVSGRGTISELDGSFSLEIKAEDDNLLISHIGYEEQNISIDDRVVYNITLIEYQVLAEIVITALGVKRDEKSLGYAVQKIDGSQISEIKSTNVTDALAGKASGVYVTAGTNGPASSTNITIRGQSSLTGNSQALFVVNGVPITNGLFTSGDGLNGSTTIDFGNAAQVISPDDIASISILKGPAAAALYGSRASNGVVLITTKTGEAAEKWEVDVNSSTTFSSVLKLPDFQDSYGSGGYGFYSYNDGSTYTSGSNGVKYYDAFGENWGPKTDGTPIKQWNSNGEPVPFTAAEGNVKEFFRTGLTAINNIALSKAYKTGDFRLSYTNASKKGIVPNTNLQRNTIGVSWGQDMLNDKLSFRVNSSLIMNGSSNVPNAGYDESSSVMYGWLWLPRQVDINDLKDYWKPGMEDVQQSYVEELWGNNPWFVVNENTNAFNEQRTIGNSRLKYEILDNLSLQVGFGWDNKIEERRFKRATSTKGIPGQFGSYREDDISFTETNTEVLLEFQPLRMAKWNMEVKLGGNIMRQGSDFLSKNNSQLLTPGVFTLENNRAGVIENQIKGKKGINSAFGAVTLSYDYFLYLDLAGRNDWSSTLPRGNNSYFYPSVSLSAILTEKMNLQASSFLSFLKLRAAYAEVGNDTDPYLLRNVYDEEPSFGNNPSSSVSSFGTNPNLRPERTSAFEFGLDARFKENRMGLDITYYRMLTRDQIIFLPVTITSGKENRLANGGEISNRGIEVSFFAQPIKKRKFIWEMNVNLGRNQAIVEKLPEGTENSYPIIADVYPGDEGSANMELVAIQGELLGQIWGLGFQRDIEGNIIHENGLPLMTTEKVSGGSYQPKLRLGAYNTFKIYDITFGFLFDGQIGGKIYSRTHALMNTGGTITNANDPLLNISTLDGRDNYQITYDANGEPVYTGTPGEGVVGSGVMYDNDGNLVPNNVAVPTRDYFYAYYGNGFNRDNVEAATYDATYFKLRELKITYDFPEKIIQKIGFKRGSVSLIGRNLLLFSKVPSIDPETYSIRNGIFVNGFESTQLPSTRNYGFSLNFTL